MYIVQAGSPRHKLIDLETAGSDGIQACLVCFTPYSGNLSISAPNISINGLMVSSLKSNFAPAV